MLERQRADGQRGVGNASPMPSAFGSGSLLPVIQINRARAAIHPKTPRDPRRPAPRLTAAIVETIAERNHAARRMQARK